MRVESLENVTNGVYQTKNDFVYYVIREKIINGELLPGERLPVSLFTEPLNVSSMPVREALQRLQQEGLVEMIPHLGARVTKFNRERFKDISMVRVELEAMAAKWSVVCLGSQDLMELERIIEEMEVLAEQSQRKKYARLDYRFHNYIYTKCGNNTLHDLVNTLWNQTAISRSALFLVPDQIRTSLKEHKNILDALKRQAAEEVFDLVKRHKLRGFRIVIETLPEGDCDIEE